MSNQVFIPVTDDLIYEHPDQIEGPLVPYFAGMECHHWLSIEINPDDEAPIASTRAMTAERMTTERKSPELRLAYSQ